MTKPKATTTQKGQSKESRQTPTVAQKRLRADEYTAKQRRAINIQLDEAQKGPFYGPFDSATQMTSHLQAKMADRLNSKTESVKKDRKQRPDVPLRVKASWKAANRKLPKDFTRRDIDAII